MADTEKRPPATFKQPSRKGKKAWRKNVDVTQVTEGLDEVREQITAGYVPSTLFFSLSTASYTQLLNLTLSQRRHRRKALGPALRRRHNRRRPNPEILPQEE